ncbi:hypothetical protein D3C86_2056710 [compost metagenome]
MHAAVRNAAPGRPARLSSWISGDENGQASEALANNLPADNAGNRFHGHTYRASHGAGQVVSGMRSTADYPSGDTAMDLS